MWGNQPRNLVQVQASLYLLWRKHICHANDLQSPTVRVSGDTVCNLCFPKMTRSGFVPCSTEEGGRHGRRGGWMRTRPARRRNRMCRRSTGRTPLAGKNEDQAHQGDGLTVEGRHRHRDGGLRWQLCLASYAWPAWRPCSRPVCGAATQRENRRRSASRLGARKRGVIGADAVSFPCWYGMWVGRAPKLPLLLAPLSRCCVAGGAAGEGTVAPPAASLVRDGPVFPIARVAARPPAG